MSALNDPRESDEAAGHIRKLIDEIVLTPDGEGKMTVDLHGEQGGILAMSLGRTPAYSPNQNGGLNFTQSAEIEQARMIASASPDLAGLAAGQVQLVAGTGFEPVTFRL